MFVVLLAASPCVAACAAVLGLEEVDTAATDAASPPDAPNGGDAPGDTAKDDGFVIDGGDGGDGGDGTVDARDPCDTPPSPGNLSCSKDWAGIRCEFAAPDEPHCAFECLATAGGQQWQRLVGLSCLPVDAACGAPPTPGAVCNDTMPSCLSDGAVCSCNACSGGTGRVICVAPACPVPRPKVGDPCSTGSPACKLSSEVGCENRDTCLRCVDRRWRLELAVDGGCPN